MFLVDLNSLLESQFSFDPSKVADSKSRTDNEKIFEAKKIHYLYWIVNGHVLSPAELVKKVQFFFDSEKKLDSIFETDSQEELLRISNELVKELHSLNKE